MYNGAHTTAYKPKEIGMIDWSEGPQYASDFVKILKSFNLVDSQFRDEDTIPETVDGISTVDAISNLSLAINKAMQRLNEAAILMSGAESDSELHDQWRTETKSLMIHLNYLINGKVEMEAEPDQEQRNQEVIDLVKAIQAKKMTDPESCSNATKNSGKVIAFNNHGKHLQ